MVFFLPIGDIAFGMALGFLTGIFSASLHWSFGGFFLVATLFAVAIFIIKRSTWRECLLFLGALVIGAALLTSLVVNEARAEQPVMPLRLFASRERSGAYAARMLYLGAMIGFFYFTTQLMQDGLGFTPLQVRRRALGERAPLADRFLVILMLPGLDPGMHTVIVTVWHLGVTGVPHRCV